MISKRLMQKHERVAAREAASMERYEAKQRARKAAAKQREAVAADRRLKRRVRACYRQAIRNFKRGGAPEFTLAGPVYRVSGRDNAKYIIARAREVLPPDWRLSLEDEYKRYHKDTPWYYYIEVYAPALRSIPAPVE